MMHEPETIDIAHSPDLLRLAEQVCESGKAYVLRRGTEELAVVTPARPRRRRAKREPTPADIEAFHRAAGSWQDVDTDKLVADIHQSRRSSRPPVEL